MPEPTDSKTRPLHKIAALVMALAAVLLFVNLAIELGASDKDSLKLAAAQAKAERDSATPPPGARLLSDSEIDAKIARNKKAILDEMENARGAVAFGRILVGVLLAVTAYRLLENSRKRIRLHCAVLAALFCVSTAYLVYTAGLTFRRFGYLDSSQAPLWLALHIATLILSPATAIFSIVVLIKPPPPPAGQPAASAAKDAVDTP
jgi:hypothetical protein